MKVIYNNLIPFRGFCAINVFGLMFVRKGCEVSQVTVNHETIHTAQMKELGYILFYIIYFVEWVVRCFMKGNAYRNISFEKEAYEHQENWYYTKFVRKPYAMWRKRRD